MNKEFYIRIDKFGNVISHGGKQKISFIDKISRTNFVEVIKIANYKEYNKNDEQTHIPKHGCCVIVWFIRIKIFLIDDTFFKFIILVKLYLSIDIFSEQYKVIILYLDILMALAIILNHRIIFILTINLCE